MLASNQIWENMVVVRGNRVLHILILLWAKGMGATWIQAFSLKLIGSFFFQILNDLKMNVECIHYKLSSKPTTSICSLHSQNIHPVIYFPSTHEITKLQNPLSFCKAIRFYSRNVFNFIGFECNSVVRGPKTAAHQLHLRTRELFLNLGRSSVSWHTIRT